MMMWKCSFGKLLQKLSYSNVESISSRWGVTGEELKSIKQHPDGFSIL